MDKKEITKNLTLALLYLQSFEENIYEQKFIKAWKGYNFSILNELSDEGFISDSKKSKSVYLTQEGVDTAKQILHKYGLLIKEIKYLNDGEGISLYIGNHDDYGEIIKSHRGMDDISNKKLTKILDEINYILQNLELKAIGQPIDKKYLQELEIIYYDGKVDKFIFDDNILKTNKLLTQVMNILYKNVFNVLEDKYEKERREFYRNNE